MTQHLVPPGLALSEGDIALCAPALQRTRELVDMVKTELTDLMDIVSAVRLWLQFSIPPAAGEDFDAKIKARLGNNMMGGARDERVSLMPSIHS